MLKLVFRPWPSLDPGQALSPASLLGAFVSPYLPVTHAHTHSLPLSVGACRVWWGVRGRCVGWTCCGIRSATVAALLFARPKRQCFVRLRRRSGLSQCCRVQDVDAQMLMSAARYLFASKNEILLHLCVCHSVVFLGATLLININSVRESAGEALQGGSSRLTQ